MFDLNQLLFSYFTVFTYSLHSQCRQKRIGEKGQGIILVPTSKFSFTSLFARVYAKKCQFFLDKEPRLKASRIGF